MLKFIGLISFLVVLSSCAGMSQHELLKAQQNCEAEVVSNAEVENKAPDLEFETRELLFGRCLSRSGLNFVAKNKACIEGMKFVSLINIEEPSFFTGQCYNAKMKIYKEKPSFEVSSTPVLEFKEIDLTGSQLLFKMRLGGVLAGEESRSLLITEEGDTASTGKVEIGLLYRYFPIRFLGIDMETGYSMGDANAPKAESMDFTRAWINNIGVSIIPFEIKTLNGQVQFVLSGGLNHTYLVIAEEYKSFVESNSYGYFKFKDVAAKGFGWYAGTDLKFVNKNGFISEFGIRYINSEPVFPKATKAFTSFALVANLGVGYHF